MKVCLTGTSGFIGNSVLNALEKMGIPSLALVRTQPKKHNFPNFITVDFNNLKNFNITLIQGCDTFLHLIGSNNTNISDEVNGFEELFKINEKLTLELAQIAAKAGIKRFIFLSSAKASGEISYPNSPFSPSSAEKPTTPYGLSKYRAEKGLERISAKSGMEFVIIRPPLVYGPGVKGNFKSLCSLVKKGYLLPFASIRNKRAFIGIENLVDFILLCIDTQKSPKAANEIFFVSDPDDISTPNLLLEISRAYDTKLRLFPIPVPILKFGFRFFGRERMFDSLVGNFQLDTSKTYELLGWKPETSMQEQLSRSEN